MEQMTDQIIDIVKLLAYGVLVLILMFIVYVAILYVIDVTQTRHTIRRNYPVIGRLRYVFEDMGVFFRQYFFALDREELPFNRAERSWVYRSAKNLDNTIAFGSTRDLRQPGTVFFVNGPYSILEDDIAQTSVITFGQDCPNPYSTDKFFHISGMSYGAISKPAVLSLGHGARAANIWLNTGEGGLSPYHLEGGADIVFQIGTAKNGVRTPGGELDVNKLAKIAEHPQVKMFEIKLSQGAKPGKGGILPGGKVTAEIAAIRGIEQGKDALSPNRQPEIDSDQSLLDFIATIKQHTGKPVGIKFVLGVTSWIDQLFGEIKRRNLKDAPDFLTIDSGDGGSGAAPMSLLDNVGLPLRESLPLIVDKLKEYGLYQRIRVVASGKIITAVDAAYALCIGANAVVTARGFMFALGCIQALQCNQNTCPTGITTHNPKMQRGLNPKDKAVRVANYARNMHKEVEIIAHSCGAKEPRLLNRSHARIVQQQGQSVTLEELYPANEPLA